MLCGTDPFPELFRAKKYKIHDKFLNRQDFNFIMRNLPIPVSNFKRVKEILQYICRGTILYKDFTIAMAESLSTLSLLAEIIELRKNTFFKFH